MRREPPIRPENILALAVAEINRIKALLARVTDGRILVIDTGTTGAGNTSPPIEAGAHTLYGVKHTRALLLTDGGGLTLDFDQGQVWIDGSFYSVASGSLAMTDATTNYVFINPAGAVAANTTGFPDDGIPLGTVVTAGGGITSINDRRSYLLPGAAASGTLHDADQIIDDDLDTFIEVEQGADDDTIRFTAATVVVGLVGAAGQWQLPVTGSDAGVLIGGDAQWYRAAANVMATPDTLRIGADLDHDGSNIGFFGTVPVAQAGAYTQTFFTADKTHAVDGSSDMPAGGTGTAAGGWDTAVNRDQAIAEFASLRATVDDLKQLVNAIIDDLQAYGLVL